MILTDEEMNKLGAKLVKAELMGNTVSWSKPSWAAYPERKCCLNRKLTSLRLFLNARNRLSETDGVFYWCQIYVWITAGPVGKTKSSDGCCPSSQREPSSKKRADQTSVCTNRLREGSGAVQNRPFGTCLAGQRPVATAGA